MRRISLLALIACVPLVGCKPADQEVLPTVATPTTTSAMTDDAAPKSEATAPAAEAPAAEAPATEAPATEAPAPAGESTEKPATNEGASNSQGAVRFVADKKLEVPAMMCPYGCYPTVEKALASVPGVKAVQLAEQPAGTPEGEINLKVVELKLGEGFDLANAIAALKKAEFDASEIQ